MTSKPNYSYLMRGLCLFLWLVLPLFSVGKDRADALFEKGNEQYAETNYKEAVISYQKVLDAVYQSASVYFNLGNAFFKTGDLASALLYYEKAHRLAPGDDDIRFNIRFANSKTTDKIESAPEFFLYKWWRGFILFFSMDTLSVLSVVFFVSGCLAFVIFMFARRVSVKRASFYMAIVFISVGLITIFMASRQSDYFKSHQQAIVFSSTVTAKSEPVNVSKDLFVIHAGTKVTVLESGNNWIKIELANGNVGWITVNAVREI